MATEETIDEKRGSAHQLRFSFDLLTDAEVGSIIDVTPQTLAGWRAQNTGPTFTKLGKNVFYRRADLDHWIYFKRKITSEGGTPVSSRPTS